MTCAGDPEVLLRWLASRVGRVPARVLAVIAHPDDESFGLGGVLAALVAGGASVSVVCLTHGEASTLGAGAALGERRQSELRAAAAELGITDVTLHDFGDGRLAEVDERVLDDAVAAHAESADLLVAFEPGGVTGHPDHRAATATAARVAHRFGLPVLEWGVTAEVAASLRAELGVPFRSLEGERAAMVDIAVDRSRQLRAIACHHSQSTDNPVLHRRLALQGPHERLRFVPPRPAV